MKFKLSAHASRKLKERRIQLADVGLCLGAPDRVEEQDGHTVVYQKAIGRRMLRVFVAKGSKPANVITFYLTSKTGKYGE